MNKVKKKALRTGVDENFVRLEYSCPKCGNSISIAAKRCPFCRNKRPDNAYERSLQQQEEAFMTSMPQRKAPQPGTFSQRPLPKDACYAQAYAPAGCMVYSAPSPSACYSSPDAERMYIPKFYSTDEYGRVFEMPVSYKPLGIGGPVPVPTPSQTVQTSPIDVPVNFKV